MIVYASLGLVVQHDGEADDERCLCGAPHGHPTARWACTARSSVTARIIAQRRASRPEPPTSPWRAWRDRQEDAGRSRSPQGDAAPASVQLRLALGASPG
ncbi:MAG: hypothetical protein OXE02_08520 [Chloroflexi bacterium]|nr:hypothetical protein [Chloroflexota bacterium]